MTAHIARMGLLMVCTLLLLTPLHAQEATEEPTADPTDRVTNGRISYAQTVEDTITQNSIFDRFTFDAREGDQIRAVMAAADGLVPRLGIADGSGDILVRSDQDADGSLLDAPEANATIELILTVPGDGAYALVPGRYDGAEGTSTGSYTLSLERVGSAQFLADLPQETFICEVGEATTLISVRFNAEVDSDEYRISAYGLGGVDPLLAVLWGSGDNELTDCSQDPTTMGGDAVILPTGETFTLEGDQPENAARFALRGGQQIGSVTANVGSIDGAPGRFMIVVEGFSLSQPEQLDSVEIALGPALAENGVAVYMVTTGQNRIDPGLEVRNEVTGEAVFCDDAGRADCTDVRSFVDAGVRFSLGGEVIGDRFTAGVAVVPRHNDLNTLEINSRARNATGDYALVIIGELLSTETGPTRPGG